MMKKAEEKILHVSCRLAGMNIYVCLEGFRR